MNLAPVDALRALPYPLAIATLARLEADLGPEAVAALRYELDARGVAGGFWTREVQRLPPPEQVWTGLVFTGEYAAGKTWCATQLFLREILAGRARRPRIICASGAAIENTVIDGASGIRAWLPPSVPFVFQRSKGYEGEAWINGVKVLCCSADAPGQAIGAGVDLDFRDDPAGWLETCGAAGAEKAWATASRSCREGLARWIASTTPEGAEFIAALLKPGQRRGVLVRDLGKPEDNAGNLAPAFLRDTVTDMRDAGTWLAKAGESPFAQIDFSNLRRAACPALVELCVSIDPNVTGTKCEVGIVGGGIDARSVVHVRYDRSEQVTSERWPAIAWDLAELLQRQHPGAPWHFLVETNRGKIDPGVLLRQEERVRLLERGKPGIPMSEVRHVRAEEDKCKRAVAPAKAAKHGHVLFADDLDKLEKQLRRLTPAGTDSDGADAAVHMINDLGRLDQKSAAAAAEEHEATATAEEQCLLVADMSAALQAKLHGRGPTDGPMKVEGAPPGDARYAGPSPIMVGRQPSWRDRSVF